MTELYTPAKPTSDATAMTDPVTPDRVTEFSIPKDSEKGPAVEKSVTLPVELKKTGVIVRWLIAARCGSAIHSRRWSFVAQGDCTQSSVCINCSKNFSRIKHQEYGGSYNIDEDTAGHKCVRCGYENTWSTGGDD